MPYLLWSSWVPRASWAGASSVSRSAGAVPGKGEKRARICERPSSTRNCSRTRAADFGMPDPFVALAHHGDVVQLPERGELGTLAKQACDQRPGGRITAAGHGGPQTGDQRAGLGGVVLG